LAERRDSAASVSTRLRKKIFKKMLSHQRFGLSEV